MECEPAHQRCGKVWKLHQRENIAVVRLTMDRLKCKLGIQGTNGARHTVRLMCTLPSASGQPSVQGSTPQSAVDLGLHRCFDLPRMVVRHLCDFCLRSRRIEGWLVSRSMHAQFVLDALDQALYARQAESDGELTHHAYRGSQYGMSGAAGRRRKQGSSRRW